MDDGGSEANTERRVLDQPWNGIGRQNWKARRVPADGMAPLKHRRFSPILIFAHPSIQVPEVRYFMHNSRGPLSINVVLLGGCATWQACICSRCNAQEAIPRLGKRSHRSHGYRPRTLPCAETSLILVITISTTITIIGPFP